MIKEITNKWKNIPLTLKVTVAYAVCSILQKCLSFITLPLFTRILTKEQYGQYTIYSSWSGIFSILLTLNLAYGSFSTAMVKFEKEYQEFMVKLADKVNEVQKDLANLSPETQSRVLQDARYIAIMQLFGPQNR